MTQGKVKWYSEQKGYGFIEPEDGEKDVFVHHSNVLENTLQEDDQVEFELEETPKGLSAINVQRI